LHQWSGPRCERVIMAFDDAAPMVEATLKPVFNNARGLGLGLMVGTHNMTDFRNTDIDMVPTAQNSTAVKVFLNVFDEEGQDFLIRNSGETTRLLEAAGSTETDGPSGRGTGKSRARHETIVPRLTREDIKRVNADPSLAIVCVSPPRGFSNLQGPTIVRLRR